jgi:hypothetical protein
VLGGGWPGGYPLISRIYWTVRTPFPIVHTGGMGMTIVRRIFVLAGLALLLGAP